MSRTSIELAPILASSAPLSRPEAVYLNDADNGRTAESLHGGSDLLRAESRISVAPVTSKSKSAMIIASITMVTGVSAMLNGLVTVILPTLARDLDLSDSVMLWPTSIQALTCGCTLLISGSIADAIGARAMYLAGTMLQTVFVVGCALSRNATEIIVFRALGGVAISFCLPSATSIITSAFTGNRRNVAFACMGGGQPLGFSLGLVFGGILTDFVNWRVGFYIAAAIIAVNFALILWGLEPSPEAQQISWQQKREQVAHEVDWVGAGIASASLAMFSYVFAVITGNVSSIQKPSNLVLLSLAVLLIPAFILWVGRQERLGRPAIIPNSLWRNRVFSTICIAVFLVWGCFNALETMLTFYFQEVQQLSAVQTSLRFLPEAVAGVINNILVGTLVHRISGSWLVNIACLIACGGPLAMAFAHETSSYWSSGFLGCILNPIGADALFTVANLLITSAFPPRTQGLAGGVFNTISQIGKSVGVATVAIIASTVTADSNITDKKSPDALMEGYRATFWYCFALSAVTLIPTTWGLARVGKVGHKRD